METYTLSQKELQRVAVISSCVQGNLACARAAALLDLTPRHVKRLTARVRQGGEGGPATRQSRTAQPSPPAGSRAGAHPTAGPHHLCRLQRPSPLRKTGREGRLLARARDSPPSVALGRDRLAP